MLPNQSEKTAKNDYQPRLLIVVAACLSVLASPVDSSSNDQAISAIKLTLKRSHSGTETMVFVSKDPAYLFPFFGSANDPSAGIPGGARIELFSSGPTSVGFDMPIGNGTPGWTGKNGGTSGVFRFLNALAPNAFSGMKTMTMKKRNFNFLKQRTSIKLSGKAVGLPLLGPQGPVAIRITTGTLRNCAVFGPLTIVEDAPGTFVAKNATGTGISDCKAQTLGGALCGNGIREPDEACDGADTGACLGSCQANCTCAPVCGDNQVNQVTEQCDGTVVAPCAGRPCLPNCQCAICGDNQVNQPSEQCDGTDDDACPGTCVANCQCLGVCGDELVNQPSEQCDGSGVGGVCGPPPLGIGCRLPGGPQECRCCSETGYFCGDFGCCSSSKICIIVGPNHSGTCCVGFGGPCTTAADCCSPLPCNAGLCSP